MSWSTHLNLHLMLYLDWMEQLFQLNVIMKSKFCTFWLLPEPASWILIRFYFCIRLLGHLNSAKNQILKYCCNSLCVFRKYAVDGISLHPTWVPFVSRASAEDQIDFSLLLMTGIKKMALMAHLFLLSCIFRIVLCNSFHDECLYFSQTIGSLRGGLFLTSWVTPLISKSLPSLVTTCPCESTLITVLPRQLLTQRLH